MSEKKPLPCPFCEGEARLQRWRRTYGYYVICKKCGCRTPVYQYQYDSKEKRREDAINTWNTRVPMERIVERLEKRFKYLDDKVEEYVKGDYIGSAKKCSLMRSQIDLAIDIVKEEGGLNDNNANNTIRRQ